MRPIYHYVLFWQSESDWAEADWQAATTVPDEAESAGGLLVASIQLAISAGAAGGGAVFDLNGASGVFVGSGVLLVSAMVIVLFAVRVKPVVSEE